MADETRDGSVTIEALMDETRVFEPSAEFVRQANISSPSIYEDAKRDRLGWWAEQAEKMLWRKKWDQVLDWSNAPFAKWFVGAELNITESCLDRHVQANPDKVAFYFEGEPGDSRVITYKELYEEVCQFANGLADLGVQKGDRVAIYMGMIPELPIALLACARLGAPHSVVFGGFSSDSLRDRVNDAEAKVVITCDEGWRNGGRIELKNFADKAVEECPSVEKMVVVQRTGGDVQMVEGRDIYYHDLIDGKAKERPATITDSEDMLFVLYTSGTTARPKGIVHTVGGYLVGAATTHRLVFDIKPDDIYFCTADIGWVTGHSYIVYGPLANGVTSVIYEGVPNYPDKDRFWEIVEKYKVTQIYTAPTAIRTFMKWGTEYP